MGGKDKGFRLFFIRISEAFLYLSMIRISTVNDAAAFLDIYTPFILNSGVTQETEIPALVEFKKRIENTVANKPWLTAEINGKIAGYAYAGNHRERKGYQYCIEPSVYLHSEFYGRNIATALYDALFKILKMQGYVNAYAVITLPNERSVAFHEKLGFRYLTTFKKIGYKLNQWHDVGWWEYQINQYEANQLVSINDLDKDIVNEIYHQSSQLITN
jgi:L-amino acid N-acyltransferase YncA